MSFFHRLREDGGSAVAAVLLVTMIVSTLGITSIQLAQHSNDSTSVDRERLQTVQSAEAGIHDALRRIEAGAGCDSVVSAFNDLNDDSGLVGRFRTRIDPEAGTLCNETPRRVIHSWGYAPTGGTRALRHIEVQVELIPHDGFAFTLFAQGGDGSIYVKNTGTITGDAYAELLDQSKNNLNGHNIITTGSLTTQNDAIYSGSLWVGGDVTVGENGVVAQSITAAGSAPGTQGNVLLDNNVQVGGDVLAKGTVTSNLGVVVNGAISQNNPNLPPPPALTKPTFTYDPANYTPAPTTGTAAQITTAMFDARNDLQGTYYSTDSETVALPNNGRVTGPLTVISTGKVDLGRNLNISGGPFQVTVIALSTEADAIDFASTFNSAAGLHVLLYTNGGVDGRNLMNFTGSIYGDSIDAKNAFTINESEWLRTNPPAGFTWDLSSASEFTAVPTLWREIIPGAPPE
jgi:hypothetical protein